MQPYNDHPSYNRTMFIAKFDTNGVFQWIKRPEPENVSTLARELYIENDVLYCFVVLEPGIYADGAFNNTLAGDNTFVLQYNTNGTFLNATHLQGFTYDTTTSVHMKFYRNPYNNHYYMVHNPRDGTIVTVNNTQIDNLFITSWDENGVYQWHTASTNPNSSKMQMLSIDFDPNNNMYISGIMNGNSSTSFLGFTIPESENTNYVLKTNPDATSLLWSTYSLDATQRPCALKYYNNEIIYTASAGGSNFVWGTQTMNINIAGTGADIILARINSQTGAILHLDSIESSLYSQDETKALAIDNNGDYIIGGGFGSTLYNAAGNTTNTTGGPTDFFVTKYATHVCEPLSVDNIRLGSIEIYPNPSKNNLFITSKNTINNLKIFNILGQKVLSKNNLLQQNVNLDISILKAGAYFVKIDSNNGVFTHTFVKE